MAAAAPRVKRLHLELGGKAPLLVFADADLQAAASGAVLAGDLQHRPGLHRRDPRLRRAPVLRRVRRRVLAEAIGAVRVGDPHDATTDIGPLIGVEHRSASTASSNAPTATAHASSAAAACPTGAGAFYPPTIVVPRTQAARSSRRRSSARCLTVLPFDDEQEAVAARERRRVRPRVVGVDERTSAGRCGSATSSSSG